MADVAVYVKAADNAARGHGRILGLDAADFGPEFGWNRDPKTGVLAPSTFGKAIDYRDERLVGDIKYLWEPNRHLHLPLLAQAALLTRSPTYARAVETHLTSWISQCPYMLGPNWSSALEVGLRLINWSWTWRLLGGSQALQEKWGWSAISVRDWTQSVHEHMHFCATYYSAHSSANNHLIGEAAGVYVGGHTWPLGPRSDAWRNEAKAILERECLKQISCDGVNLEQATSYQLFSFEMLVAAGVVGQVAGDPFSREFWERLYASMRFVAAIDSAREGLPHIGDSDDALALQLAPDDRVCQVESDLYAAGVLFDRSDYRKIGAIGRERAEWFLAGLSEPVISEPDCEPVSDESRIASIQSFPVGGYHVMEMIDPLRSRIRALFDVGPLGYAAIAAHGHADALSLLLWVDELEFLIDSGTYAYHTEPDWRAYFRGTSAHNTVVIDDMDQSVPGGNFMWTRHAKVELMSVSHDAGSITMCARHDGYRRLRDAVDHRRTVHLDAVTGKVTVTDDLECRGSHSFDLRWHISDRCDVALEGSGVRLARENLLLTLHCDGPHSGAVMLRGSMEPRAGWISRRFGVRTPCPTISFRSERKGSARFVTTFRVHRRLQRPDVSEE